MRKRLLMIVLLALFSKTESIHAQAIYDMIDPANQNTSILFGKPNESKQPHYLMEFFNTGTVKFSNGAYRDQHQAQL